MWLFSCSVMSNSLQSHGLQHAMLHCPPPYPRACLNSCSLSWWCHPTISCLELLRYNNNQTMSWRGNDIIYLNIPKLSSKSWKNGIHLQPLYLDLSRNTIYWSNTLYKYKVQSWFSYSAVSIRTQTFGILSFDILRNVGFSFSYWSPYGCRMAALLQLHLRLTSFQIKRKKQRPFPDLACPCFFFSPLEWRTPQQVFPLSLCLELVFTRTS